MEEGDAELNGNSTTITLENGTEIITVSIEGSDLPYIEFMELIELLIINARYSKDEIESYIVTWAEDIKATREN